MTFLNVLIAAVQGMENGAILYSWADCPDDQCCGLHAPTSTLTVDNRLTCPILSTEWVDCTECGWEPVDEDHNPPRSINGDIRCGECAADYSQCEGCGRDRVTDEMNTECNYPDGMHWCDRCWDNRSGCSGFCCNGSDYDDDDDDECPRGEPVRRCSTCGSNNRHMDLLSEAFVCDHAAKELLDHFVPVKLIAPLPDTTVIPSDCEWADTVAEAWDEVLSSQPS